MLSALCPMRFSRLRQEVRGWELKAKVENYLFCLKPETGNTQHRDEPNELK